RRIRKAHGPTILTGLRVRDEPLARHDHVRSLIAERVVEVENALVAGSHHELDLRAPQPHETTLRFGDQRPADAPTAVSRRTREVVEPAAVPVVSGDDGSHDGSAVDGDEHEVRIRASSPLD